MSRGERTAQYNRLLRIAEDLGQLALYPGASVFKLAGRKPIPQEIAR